MAHFNPDLVWQLVKNHNSFKVQRGQHTFSSERFNLRNKHSFSSSGLAQKRGIDVQPKIDKKGTQVGVVLSTTSTSATAARKPAKRTSSTPLTRDFRRGARVVSQKSSIAPRLKFAALARYSQIRRAERPSIRRHGINKARRAKQAKQRAAAKRNVNLVS